MPLRIVEDLEKNRMSRFLSWFSTENGRKFSKYCVGAATLSVFGSQMAFHGPLLEKVKEVCQAYQLGEPRPLPANVNGLLQEVLHDCSLKEEQKKKLKFFYVVGHDLFHAGGINSPWGAIVGIPFTFQTIKDIDLGELRMQGKDTLDWVIEGRDLLDALNMSDNAKKFALMREIYSCNLLDTTSNALIGAGCVAVSARISQIMNTWSNAFKKLSVGNRCSRYFLFYTLGYILYRLLKDPLKHISDRKVDRLVAETGKDYLEGGIEYYQQTLLRNKALGEMLNTTLRKFYDKHGNENYFLLVPKLPVSKRLDLLKDMKKEMSAPAEDKDSK